jgi:hypothetical protein
MESTEVYISSILGSKSGFAMRTDNGEKVFVPSIVTKASGISENDISTAKLIPSTHPNHKEVPWIAVHITRAGEAPPVLPSEEQALALIRQSGFLSTAEVATGLGVGAVAANNMLTRLFKDGKLAKAEIHARPEQGRASFCMWALETKDFIGEQS